MARRKKQNEDEQNNDNINNESDDTFGLPEVEYEPLKRDEPKEEVQPEPVVETTDHFTNRVVARRSWVLVLCCVSPQTNS
jgi:hypothetical protein